MITLMEEGVRALKEAWTGEPFTYRGRPARIFPRPLQQPHPPVVACRLCPDPGRGAGERGHDDAAGCAASATEEPAALDFDHRLDCCHRE